MYAELRPAVLGAGDDRLQARLLAQEARGLLDRRAYARALVRLEEAMGAAADEPAERAALSIDLAATLYHSGRTDRSEAALSDAVAAAAAAGREDLARIARSNRIELWIDRCDFASAAAEIAELEKGARAEKDRTRLLVALHQRSRLALRRGELSGAARDNAEARRLAEAIGDRLEIGELWLEEGDRSRVRGRPRRRAPRLGTGGAGPARPLPDRPRRAGAAGRARPRARRGPAGPALTAESDALFATDPFRASEAVARWCGLLGRTRLAGPLRDRAAAILRGAAARGLWPNASRSPSGAKVSEAALRELRRVVVLRIGGAEIDAVPALRAIGLSRLAVRDDGGRELVRLGGGDTGGEAWQPLEAGSAPASALALAPCPPAEVSEAVALLLETLLYRAAADAARPDASEAWRQLGIVTADPRWRSRTGGCARSRRRR